MWEEMQSGLQCTRVLQPQPQNLQFIPHIGQICRMEESKPHFFCGCGITCTGIHPAKCRFGRNAASCAVSLITDYVKSFIDSYILYLDTNNEDRTIDKIINLDDKGQKVYLFDVLIHY